MGPGHGFRASSSVSLLRRAPVPWNSMWCAVLSEFSSQKCPSVCSISRAQHSNKLRYSSSSRIPSGQAPQRSVKMLKGCTARSSSFSRDDSSYFPSSSSSSSSPSLIFGPNKHENLRFLKVHFIFSLPLPFPRWLDIICWIADLWGHSGSRLTDCIIAQKWTLLKIDRQANRPTLLADPACLRTIWKIGIRGSRFLLPFVWQQAKAKAEAQGNSSLIVYLNTPSHLVSEGS